MAERIEKPLGKPLRGLVNLHSREARGPFESRDNPQEMPRVLALSGVSPAKNRNCWRGSNRRRCADFGEDKAVIGHDREWVLEETFCPVGLNKEFEQASLYQEIVCPSKFRWKRRRCFSLQLHPSVPDTRSGSNIRGGGIEPRG